LDPLLAPLNALPDEEGRLALDCDALGDGEGREAEAEPVEGRAPAVPVEGRAPAPPVEAEPRFAVLACVEGRAPEL